MQPLAILWFSFAAVAVSWVGDVGGVSTSYLEVQLTGLEALYNATSGEQWTFSRGWKDATLGICGWYGVMCDSRGQNATALLLASNGLAGNLNEAAELFEILSLVKVDLSDNELVGPVPLGLGLMPGLEVLDLSRNQLSSFPTSWGAEAYTLRHLSLQLNNISGPLPSAWLNVRSSTSYPLVHSKEVSSWLPELRTLALGGNAISMPVYHALQAVIGFASLQVLDLSSNALHGRIDQSFEQHYCGGGSLDACDSIAIKAGASILAITLLASNLIEGELEANSLPKSMSVLTISDNLLNGSVPEDYAQLSVFMADGNEWLQHTSLPGFASYANSSTIVTKHQNLSCPVISGKHAAGRSVRLSLDPSYLSYSHCVCIEGMEGNAQDGCQACPEGTYRGTAELFVTRSCISCPANSWSMATGAESVSECKCQAGFYDTLGGVGDEDGAPSCVACPYDNGAWDSAGAINVATCSCPAGRYLDEAARTCSECDAGTYKTSVGNDVRLCVPCARGTYSPQRGRTNSEACIPCEAGTFSPTSGAASSSTCLPCPRGTYSSKVGLFSAELCARCPAGYYLEGEGIRRGPANPVAAAVANLWGKQKHSEAASSMDSGCEGGVRGSKRKRGTISLVNNVPAKAVEHESVL